MWTPVSFDTGFPTEALSTSRKIAVVVPHDVGGTVLRDGSYPLLDIMPPNKYLVRRLGNYMWVGIPKPYDFVICGVINKYLMMENKMSYATGKSDFGDHKTYANQSASGWSYVPVAYQPVKFSGGQLVPAHSTDEVIYGIVLSSAAVETTQTDENGNQTTSVTGYDLKILIADAELTDASLSFAQSNYGSPLYVQDYSAEANPTFNDIYDMNAPSTGFTHPLYLISGATSMHYNGTVRPEQV
jgi:hypothetical protein